MAVTDDEFGALAAKAEGLSVRVRTLEDDRAIDRAEAQIRHRAVIDSMQALHQTHVDFSRELTRQGRELAGLRTDVERGFARTDGRFAALGETLAHVVRLLEHGPGGRDAPDSQR